MSLLKEVRAKIDAAIAALDTDGLSWEVREELGGFAVRVSYRGASKTQHVSLWDPNVYKGAALYYLTAAVNKLKGDNEA